MFPANISYLLIIDFIYEFTKIRDRARSNGITSEYSGSDN